MVVATLWSEMEKKDQPLLTQVARRKTSPPAVVAPVLVFRERGKKRERERERERDYGCLTNEWVLTGVVVVRHLGGGRRQEWRGGRRQECWW
ncbi:hypothetical protein HanIR_Chr09g0437251 [Helianthus annuus]|nr:hypothetical protein HanIR_Chr09g0437251 [Helianthus annuus]